MPIKTSLTALLDIEHPILSAPMDVIAGARLTMAVSAAGGFGILGGGYGDRAWLEQEAAKLKQRTGAPFGVGFITWSLAKQPELLDIALDAKPHAVMLSFGDPRPFAPRIKAAGARLICQVQTEDMARQALDAGADILVAQGSEAGGHGASRTTIDIVPAIVDIAAGRICTATSGNTVRGIVFDLSRNNVWPAPFTGRCLINDHSRRWSGREVELLQNVTAVAADYAAAKAAGNFDVAAVIAGEAVGLIHDIPPAAEIVERIINEADQILRGQRNSSAALRA
jgi:nitronate monooxygenase